MDVTQLNEVTLVLVSGVVAGLVQLAKMLKVNAFLLLAVFSFIATGIYYSIVLYYTQTQVENWGFAMLQIAATANLVYNLLKKIYEKMVSKR